jgi:hypothetical protein
MNSRNVIWTPVVREKLIEFRNERFTPEETLNYISQIIIETEEFLRNPVIGKTYTEEFGRYKGISRLNFRYHLLPFIPYIVYQHVFPTIY